jgi:hypothetical protein
VLIAVSSFFGIPAERKFLGQLRKNAYPDEPSDE